ncbi:MAG: hypothetical protein WD097_03315 [Balneolales bacterium]
MKTHSKLLIMSLFSSLVIVAGCDSIVQVDDAGNGESLQAGSFSLSRIQSPEFSKQQAASLPESQDEEDFDLGDIGNTTEFYFVLTNSGETDIEDITLSSNHPGFQIYPASIPVLKPVADVGLYQVIRLTAVHGTAPNGVGPPAPVMEPGTVSTEVKVKGETTDAKGDTLEIELETKLSVHAQLADIRVFHEEGEVDLSSPSGSVMGSRVYSEGVLRKYTIPRDSGPITVENTGNVKVEFSAFAYRYPDFNKLPSFELNPGETGTVDWPFGSFVGASNSLSLVMGTGNIITEQERLPFQDDGKVYVVLSPEHNFSP